MKHKELGIKSDINSYDSVKIRAKKDSLSCTFVTSWTNQKFLPLPKFICIKQILVLPPK